MLFLLVFRIMTFSFCWIVAGTWPTL